MRSRKLIKNYLYNTAYQILLLISPLITTPYISRILGATNVGAFQYTQSIATYFILLSEVGTTLYGQREIAYAQDKPKERSVIFWEIELFRIISTLICVIIFFLVFCIDGLYSIIYCVLILEVLSTAFDITWFYMGMENFRITVIRNIIIKFLGIIAVFLFVKKEQDLIIYTICMTVPIFIGNLSLWFSLRKYLVRTKYSISNIIKGIRKRLKPIFVFFIPQVAIDIYIVLDKTMIGILGSNIAQVGYYAQSQKIVKLALMVVTSLGTVMFPAMSALFAKGDYDIIRKNIIHVFQFVYMLGFALISGLCAIASRFVPIFFGEGYDPVANLMIIICPIIVLIATSNVLGKQYLLPTKQQKAFTMSVIVGAIVNFVLNIILIGYFDAIGASISTVVAELSVALVQCWYVRNQLPLRKCILSGARYALYGALMFAIVKTIDLLLPCRKVWVLIFMIIIGALFYGGLLFVTRDPMVRILMDFVAKYKEKTNN